MNDASGLVDYVAECRVLEKRVGILERELVATKRTIDVLVAVGHVSQEKVEQAREIINELTP